MNQLENNSRKHTSAGRSRSRGSDSSTSRSNQRSTASRRASYERANARSGRTTSSAGRMNTTRTGHRSSGYRRRREPDYKKIAVIGVILLVLIVCIALALKARGKSAGDSETSAEETSQTETEVMRDVKVDGIVITGMTRSQARNAILGEYPWSMTVKYGEDSYQVTDLMAEKVDRLLDEIYAGEPDEEYTLDMSGLEEAAASEAAACAARWDKKAKNGSISSFDTESNRFVFAGEENGFAIDQEKLAADILQALADKRFDAVIAATGSEVAPEISAEAAKEKYKIIGTYTTTTTANANRNTNVRLAAEAVNGTVLQPGEEFSFNGTVGRRTEAKGYKSAAAYNNGEVVQEIGGGVCQVSSTLYNAVVRCGLQISYRRSHTFEPTYVTPGQDATVSWEQPDFKFINNTETAIGIKASYADRKMTVSIYGIPILEEGITWDMVSEKVENLEVPAPIYEEDQTLQPDVEVQKSAGSAGSRWQTYKVVYKDGKEISREVDHKTTYKGHAPVVLRNTSGVVLNPEETTISEETTIPTIDGMPEDYVPDTTAAQPSPGPGGETVGGEGGPGMTTVPPTTEAPAGPQDGNQPAGPAEGAPVIAPLEQ